MGQGNSSKWQRQSGEPIPVADVMEIAINLTTPLITEARKYSTKLKDFAKFHSLIDSITANQTDPFPDNEPTRAEAVPAFLHWCNENGICYRDLQLREHPTAGMGLQSLGNIDAQQMVIAVPYSAMLTSEEAFTEFGDLMDDSGVSRNWMQVPVALKLIKERIQSDESSWKPYIDVLPKSLPHPIFLTPKDFAQLGGSPAYEDAINLFYEVSSQYGLIYRELCRQWEAGTLAGPLDPETLTFDAYRWGMALALTRSLKVIDGTGTAVTVLVPFWDMCNNGQEALYTKVDIKGSEQTAPGLYAYTLRQIQSGEEMLICYRDSSTPNEYFTIWGLAQVNYFSPISVKISALDRNYATKYNLLDRLQSRCPPIDLKISRDAIPLSTPDLQALLIICATTGDLKTGMVSSDTWARAWEHVIRRIKRRLALYSYKWSSYAPQPWHTAHTRLAIGQVCAEKQIMENALKAAQVLMTVSPSEIGFIEFLEPLESEAHTTIETTATPTQDAITSHPLNDSLVEVGASA